jgi:hypothetical protein
MKLLYQSIFLYLIISDVALRASFATMHSPVSLEVSHLIARRLAERAVVIGDLRKGKWSFQRKSTNPQRAKQAADT